MEPKKIKKLVITKETISVLNDYEQSKHKGGGVDTGYAMCLNYTKNGAEECFFTGADYRISCFIPCSAACSQEEGNICFEKTEVVCPTFSCFYC